MSAKISKADHPQAYTHWFLVSKNNYTAYLATQSN